MVVIAAIALVLVSGQTRDAEAQNRRNISGKRDADIEEIERRLEQRRREEARLKDEASSKAKEVEALRQNLIDTAAALQDAEKRISEISAELVVLEKEESVLKTSLESEQEVLGEILGALQALERSRPPAILVTPEDSATAARTAILLSSAAPELKDKADALKRDIDRLATVTKALARERASYQKTNDDVGARRQLLADLLKQKQKERDVAQRLASAAQSETAALAARRSSVRGVLDGLEELAKVILPRIKPPVPEIDPSKENKPMRPRNRQTPTETDKSGEAVRIAKGVTKTPKRIVKPKTFRTDLPFGKARGQLNAPVVGDLVGKFGKSKPEGGSFEGVRYAAKDGAIVTSPYPASVAFARFYRPTGNMIVLDVGDGYHVLLMGVGTFLTEEGQTVAAGEPLAVMTGQDAKLELQIRRYREPVNPAKWLASESG